ncbi:hypothetical protein K0F72_03360 [Bacteroides fragilis]|nr:hypothetical protein [Bacteroides fragilis]
MEKEQILSEITTRIGKTSLSQRTLTDYVSSNLPTEGAEPDDAFWEKHVGFLKSLDGNFSHDVSTQVEEFKKNYKPNQQQANDTTQEGKDNEVLELLKGIKNENKELRERLDRQDQAKSQSELREKVVAGMKAKGISDEYVLNTTLAKHGELDSKKSVDELVESLLPAYDKEFSACRGNGAVPRTGQQQQQNTKNETLKKFKERHQKSGDLPVAK